MTKVTYPADLVHTIVNRMNPKENLASLRREAARAATKALRRREDFDRIMACVEVALQRPDGRRRAIILIETLRVWNSDRAKAEADAAMAEAKREHAREHARLVALTEHAEAMLEEADEFWRRHLLNLEPSIRLWRRLADDLAKQYRLGRTGRPHVGLSFDGARALLRKAGLSTRVADALLKAK